MGRLLRVDLSSGSIRVENLPEESVLKKFIGGQLLASYLLFLKNYRLMPNLSVRKTASSS